MSLFINPSVRASDANGNTLSGATWTFYTTGTTDLADIYTTSALTTAHANPVVADAGGLFAPIYLDPGVTYRAVLKTSGGTTIQDIDPYSGGSSTEVSGVHNLLDYGAVSNATTANLAAGTATDCSTAIEAALADMDPRGATLFIPAGRYYFTRTVNITQNVIIKGEGMGQNPGIVGDETFAFPDYVHGTVLIFAANVKGFEFHPHNTSQDNVAVALLPDAERYAEYSSTNSQMRDLAIVSRSAIAASTSFTATADPDKDGILVRARVKFENLFILSFAGHGLHINSDSGGVDFGQMFGTANHSQFTNIMVWGSGQDGIHVEGRDANNCFFHGCDSHSSGGWGIYDESLSANVYEACQIAYNNKTLQASATANIGSAKTVNAANTASFRDCYCEASDGYISELTQAITVDGGNFAGAVFHPETSAAHIRAAGVAVHAPWTGKSTLGDTTVYGYLGRDPSGAALNTIFSYAADDIAAVNQGHFSYVVADKAWRWHAGGIGNDHTQFPTQESNWRGGIYAPSFTNGIFLGRNAAGPRIFYGATAPASGTWALGDVVWNSQPAVGEPSHWQCVVAGTPGTWAASANLV